MPMNKFYIYKNIYKNINAVLDDLLLYSHRYNLIETKDINEADFIISIGGDGTFLDAAKCAIGTPIFGINMGTLGYLTEINPSSSINKTLMDYSNNNYEIQKRMMLDYTLYDNNKKVKDDENGLALNDVVISKFESSIIGFDVIVDDVNVTSYYGDGVIISTPTGSTGYSLSCGGPIVDPNSEMMIITPVAPHTMINRSMVISATSKVSIRVSDIKYEHHALLSVDGNNSNIYENEVISVYKAKSKTNIISFSENNFFEQIRQKMR